MRSLHKLSFLIYPLSISPKRHFLQISLNLLCIAEKIQNRNYPQHLSQTHPLNRFVLRNGKRKEAQVGKVAIKSIELLRNSRKNYLRNILKLVENMFILESAIDIGWPSTSVEKTGD